MVRAQVHKIRMEEILLRYTLYKYGAQSYDVISGQVKYGIDITKITKLLVCYKWNLLKNLLKVTWQQ